MEEHTFTLPEQQARALDELKNRLVPPHGRSFLFQKPWVFLALGLAAAALIATVTKAHH